MYEDRRNSFSFMNYSRYLIFLYILDCCLSLFVVPFSGTSFWITTDNLLKWMQNRNVQVLIIYCCAVTFILVHVCCKSLYRFIKQYTNPKSFTFFIVSKIYIYISAVCGTVVYAGILEARLDEVLELENLVLNSIITVVGFAVLFGIKCHPHLAGFSGSDVGQDSTPEDVFLFPYRLFSFSVTLTEYVENRFLYFFSSRLYTEIFGIASVSSWYGIWTAFDKLAGANLSVTISIVLLSYIGLFFTKTVRNVTASPFAIITDKKQGYFDVPTLFQWSSHWKKNKFLYVLDSIFSVFIVGTLVILVWRGAWCVLDKIICEEDYERSGRISLGIGYIIVLITFVSQSFIKTLIRKCDGWKRLVVLDTYIVISFCGTINIWRGIWILLELKADLDKSLRNCLLLHFLSFFILVIFNSSNTLLVRGVYVDAKEDAEDCVEFPCYYFRLRFQEKQKKKALLELKKINDEAKVDHDDVERKDSLLLLGNGTKEGSAETASNNDPKE